MPAYVWASDATVRALRIIDRYEPTTTHQFGRLLFEDDPRWFDNKTARGKKVLRGKYRLGWTAGKIMSDLIKKRKYVRQDKETGIYELTKAGMAVLAKFGKE